MASARKITYHFQLFLSAYPQQTNTEKQLRKLLPDWSAAYFHLLQEIDNTLYGQSDTLSRQKDFVDLLETLRDLRAPDFKEEDLRAVFVEAQLLYLLLRDEQLNTFREDTIIGRLLSFVEQHLLTALEQQTHEKFSGLSRKISSLLPTGQEGIFWSVILAPSAKYPTAALSTQAIQQLAYLQNYLIKRQLAISIQDPDCKVLWMNPLEDSWLRNLRKIAFIAEKEVHTGRFQIVTASLLQAVLLQIGNPAIKSSSFWIDPLPAKQKGVQTRLFSSSLEKQATHGLTDHTFASLVLDLRAEQPAYPYQKKILRQQENQLREHFFPEDHQLTTPTYRALMLYRAEELAAPKSLLVLLLDRRFLTDASELPLRSYLGRSYQQIFVLDYCREKDPKKEGVCAIFLVSGKRPTKDRSAKILYAALDYQASEKKDAEEFENISWEEIKTDQQAYWIGLPPGDFLNFIPAYESEGAFFREHAHFSQSLMPDWLMDDDPNLLQKKVKYLIKEYQKSLSFKSKPKHQKISWPATVKKMAKQGVPLEFNSELIQKVMVRPLVSVYWYAEDKLTQPASDARPAIILRKGTAEAVATSLPVHQGLLNGGLIFPLFRGNADQPYNISEEALVHFQDFYSEKAKNLNSNFIVFPPENITLTLDKIASASQDLPVIRKYPEQIIKMLTDARNFTSDVELLAPPYEKIEEFRQKVLRLERDAIERKVIYQRVKTYIEQLKEQLRQLTQEYDEAQRDLAAVNQENLFYYFYAILNDPDYRLRYADYLQWELPRIPLHPHFRQWVQWGKSLFELHSLKKDAEPIPLTVEEQTLEKPVARFSYQLSQQEAQLTLREGHQHIRITDIPDEVWSFTVNGLTPLEHLLQQLATKPSRDKILLQKFAVSVLAEPRVLIEKLSRYCGISLQTSAIRQTIKDTRQS